MSKLSDESNVAHEEESTVVHMDPEHRRRVEKSLKRKLDARCSLFVLIYIMNYLDRNNIAAARLGGLQEDLNINNTQYATCLSIRMLQSTTSCTSSQLMPIQFTWAIF
jgi:hypothetical protein